MISRIIIDLTVFVGSTSIKLKLFFGVFSWVWRGKRDMIEFAFIKIWSRPVGLRNRKKTVMPQLLHRYRFNPFSTYMDFSRAYNNERSPTNGCVCSLRPPAYKYTWFTWHNHTDRRTSNNSKFTRWVLEDVREKINSLEGWSIEET